MPTLPEPSDKNNFLAEHLKILSDSLTQWTGRNLIDAALSPCKAAHRIYFADFALVSHNTAGDPVFNYGNHTALNLFEMDWSEFTNLPSRLSAEPINREQRAALLSQVSKYGYIENYQGIRISRSQKRFLIKDALVWNVLDATGNAYGQAAFFRNWSYL